MLLVRMGLNGSECATTTLTGSSAARRAMSVEIAQLYEKSHLKSHSRSSAVFEKECACSNSKNIKVTFFLFKKVKKT